MTEAFLHGFSPVLPVLLVIFLAVLSLLAGWWSYKNLDNQPNSIRLTLISLRSLTLLILCFLLLNPYINREETEINRVEIPVLLDNSASVGVDRGDYLGISDYQSVYERFREFSDRQEQVTFTEYLIGVGVRESDNPDYSDPSTNLQEAIEFLLENENRISAAVMFTDGIHTRGRNPVFQAQNLSIPLIIFPLGDSTSVKDISIAQVDYNDPVYTNTSNRITAEIRHRGFEGMETNVVLLEDDLPVETRTVLFPSSSGTEWIEFDRTYTEEGFVNLSIEVEPLDEEFTTENNSYQTAITVLDDKITIASLAYEIHPDVSSIRRYIATNPQHELLQTTYLGNNRFTGTPPSALEPNDIDLLVVHGLPGENDPALNRLFNADLPIVYFASPKSYNDSRIRGDNSSVLYSVEGRINTISVTPIKDSLRVSNPVLESLPSIQNRFPTLNTVQGQYRITTGADVLIWSLFEQRRTSIPILITADYGNIRKASVNAYGWNRYELSTQDEVRQYYYRLLDNLISWTSTPGDDRLLVLQPLSSVFSEREQVQIRATLTNERGEREPNASINVTLRRLDREITPLTFQMRHVENGIYELDAGRYPSGIYSMEGVAMSGNRELGRDQTQFTISSVNEELINTRRNDLLINQLATITGGFVADSTGMERFSDFIDQLASENTSENTVTITDYLYRDSIWFVLILILLTAEWLLRRKISLP